MLKVLYPMPIHPSSVPSLPNQSIQPCSCHACFAEIGGGGGGTGGLGPPLSVKKSWYVLYSTVRFAAQKD
jgi:hypothetical protein